MEQIKETLDYLNLKTNNFKPEIAIILGSGLGCFCDNLSGINVKYKEIPHFGSSNVQGHKGELLFCEINSKKPLEKISIMKYNERVSGGRSEMKISLTGILPRSAANNRRLPEKQSRKCLINN